MTPVQKITAIAEYCNSINPAKELAIDYMPFDLAELAIEDNFSLDIEDWEDDDGIDNDAVIAEMKAIIDCKIKHLQKISELLSA